jgi:hypothetical protein
VITGAMDAIGTPLGSPPVVGYKHPELSIIYLFPVLIRYACVVSGLIRDILYNAKKMNLICSCFK